MLPIEAAMPSMTQSTSIGQDRMIENKTSKKVRDKVKSQLEGVEDAASMRDIMSSVSAEIEENKL